MRSPVTFWLLWSFEKSSCIYFIKLRYLNDHQANISTLLTFPRCAIQQRDEGVDEVGAATRWENSVENKERVERWEKENIVGWVRRGKTLLLPQGVRQGARGKRDGGLCCLGGWTTGNDKIIRTSIWQEINTAWAESPRGNWPDIVENYNKLFKMG